MILIHTSIAQTVHIAISAYASTIAMVSKFIIRLDQRQIKLSEVDPIETVRAQLPGFVATMSSLYGLSRYADMMSTNGGLINSIQEYNLLIDEVVEAKKQLDLAIEPLMPVVQRHFGTPTN